MRKAACQGSERIPGRGGREFEIAGINSEPQPESGTDRHHNHIVVVGRERRHAEEISRAGYAETTGSWGWGSLPIGRLKLSAPRKRLRLPISRMSAAVALEGAGATLYDRGRYAQKPPSSELDPSLATAAHRGTLWSEGPTVARVIFGERRFL